MSSFSSIHLLSYCQQEHLTFTRSRPYKKNDQAYVEQKNWSIVRHLVGYGRYEGQKAWDALQRLYDGVRLYVNFFQPSMKLLSKERVGAKVKKHYDDAKTPYQRVLADAHVAPEVKARLEQEYLTLNPLALLTADAPSASGAVGTGALRCGHACRLANRSLMESKKWQVFARSWISS